MPKARGGFEEEEEEKTTIESGWEEEASTTVEQGDVADKIRALVEPPRSTNTNVTATNGGLINDEPTVDDRRANLAGLLQQQSATARLHITQGNDTGQMIEIVPTKTYTIGRAVDNDVVLTDIAVSRKHFDLRHEASGWVLADRGSGNGTLVNGNVEDQPFVLANGDLIEIGNTTFRFDHPGAARPEQEGTAGFGVDLDEEPSTVAGKPLRAEGSAALPARPKTTPPLPAPSRAARPSTRPPPMAYPQGSQPQPVVQPLPSKPVSGPLLARQQTVPPQSKSIPVHFTPQQQPAQQPMVLGADGMAMPHPMQTTIPGQGMPMQQHQHQQQQHPYPYPMLGEHHAPHLIVGTMPRDATSTALVPPTPYGSAPMQPMQPMPSSYMLAPTISRRTKLMVGGAALALFAAIATAGIIKSSAGGGEAPATDLADETAPAPTTRPAIEAIEDKPPAATQAVAKIIEDKQPEPVVAKPEPVVAKPVPAIVKAEPVRPAPRPEPKKAAPPPKRPEPKRPEPKRPEPKRPEPKRVAASDSSGVRTKAEQLYRAKKFNDAAAALKAAAPQFGDAEAKALKSIAGTYEQFGRSFNNGMASGTKATDAYFALTKARNMDQVGAFRDEIKQKLGPGGVAARAAIAFASTKEYEASYAALRVAESSGGASDSTRSLRESLENAASKLYNEAAREIDSNPEAAKAKLKRIKAMVDPKSPWLAKAAKLLAK